MTITIEGNLTLTKDTVFDEDLVVRGNIICEGGKFDLTVKGNINCFDINSHNIDCHDINCCNIDCLNIDCHDINCYNINCHDINCFDIDCAGINYYAVCFAYNNIKCKSIKGRRKNSKHFVLDGKIEIIGD